YFSAAFSLPSSDSINISVTITSAPASAKARASARPRPRDAPVTTATLPANKLAHDDINLPPIFHYKTLALLFERMLLTQFLRSEEHTSELQSRFELVCRLLLAK